MSKRASEPSVQRPGPISILIGLAVPLGVAALFVSLGRTGIALLVASIGLAILALRVFAPRYGEIVMAALAVFGAWVGRGVSALLLGIIYFAVFTPVAFTARLLGRDPLALASDAGGWQELGADPPVRLFTNSFSREANTERSALPLKMFRLAKRLLTAVVVLVLVDIGIGGIARLTLTPFSAAPDERQNLNVFSDTPWRMNYWDEYVESKRMHYEPYVGWRRDDFQGEHINITASARETYASPAAAADAPLVFIYGGSTTWGVGARDAHTISSELVRLSEAKGSPVRVRNFGESGWVSWQEAILLSHHLSMGERPDVVVFYDGANDVSAKLASPDEYHPPQNITSRRIRFDATFARNAPLKTAWKTYVWLSATQIASRRFQSREPVDMKAILGDQSIEELASEVAVAYVSHIELVKALSAAYGFEAIFVWQPIAGTKELRSDEELTFQRAGTFDAGTVVRILDLAGDELLSVGEVHDLRGAFDNTPQSMYIDWAHTTEEANSRIARRIYPLVLKALSVQREQSDRGGRANSNPTMRNRQSDKQLSRTRRASLWLC